MTISITNSIVSQHTAIHLYILLVDKPIRSTGRLFHNRHRKIPPKTHLLLQDGLDKADRVALQGRKRLPIFKPRPPRYAYHKQVRKQKERGGGERGVGAEGRRGEVRGGRTEDRASIYLCDA